MNISLDCQQIYLYIYNDSKEASTTEKFIEYQMWKWGNEPKIIKKLLGANQLNLLELSVIVFGLFCSISPSGSMQIWCEWVSCDRTFSLRLSIEGTTITTSPLQSFSKWLTYCVGTELLWNEGRLIFMQSLD